MLRTAVAMIIAMLLMLTLPATAVAQDGAGANEVVLTKVLALHRATRKDCDDHLRGREATEVMRLGKQTWAVLVQCQVHAYQSSWLAYAAHGPVAHIYISRLSFASTFDGRMFMASEWLMSPEWDEKTKTLHTFHKGRGMGDCGSAENLSLERRQCSIWRQAQPPDLLLEQSRISKPSHSARRSRTTTPLTKRIGRWFIDIEGSKRASMLFESGNKGTKRTVVARGQWR